MKDPITAFFLVLIVLWMVITGRAEKVIDVLSSAGELKGGTKGIKPPSSPSPPSSPAPPPPSPGGNPLPDDQPLPVA